MIRCAHQQVDEVAVRAPERRIRAHIDSCRRRSGPLCIRQYPSGSPVAEAHVRRPLNEALRTAARSTERELLRRRREQQRLDAELVAAELLDRAGPDGAIDGAELSTQAFATLRDFISRSGLRAGITTAEHSATAHGVQVIVARVPEATTTVACPEGRLTMHDLVVRLTAADGAGPDR